MALTIIDQATAQQEEKMTAQRQEFVHNSLLPDHTPSKSRNYHITSIKKESLTFGDENQTQPET